MTEASAPLQNKSLWEGPPSPPLMTGDASCQGPLGISLSHALADLEDEDSKTTQDSAHGSFQFTPHAIQRISASLAETAAATSIPNTDAVLHGQLEHFNRRGRKWRFVVNNAEFRERPALNRHRRKRDRKSLWELAPPVSESQPQRMEILAYNDDMD